jgi:predicted acetyltransferase
MKGYMRVLFEDTVRYMVDESYDCSMLFGIPNFYPKFGYAVCLPFAKVTIQTRDAELAKVDAKSCTTRPIAPGDLPAIVDLYNQRNADRTCTLVRSAEYFKGFNRGTHWNQPAEAIILLDAQGAFAGYAAWDKSAQAVNVMEVESVDPSFYPALLHEFARQAIEKRCDHISLFMPPDHPFAEFMQRYGCEWTIQYMRHSDGMIRLLNQDSLFEKIVLELQRRTARVRVAAGALTFETDLGATTINLHEGVVRVTPGTQSDQVIKLPQDKLAQLVVGYRSASDLLTDPAIQACGDARPLLDTLFPKCQPHVWMPDYF